MFLQSLPLKFTSLLSWITGLVLRYFMLVPSINLTPSLTVLILFAADTIHRMTTLPWVYMSPLPPFPYPLGEAGVTCNFLSNTYCPVVKDEVMKYTLRMPIQDFMTAVSSFIIKRFPKYLLDFFLYHRGCVNSHSQTWYNSLWKLKSQIYYKE